MRNFNIGEKIASLRIEKDLTQKELAEKLNISNHLVVKWETNKSIPSLDNLIEICKIFDKQIDYFIDERATYNTDENITNISLNNQKSSSFKLKLILSFSIAGVIDLIMIAGIILLSIFCLVPAINHNKYMTKIENGFMNYFTENNFFNIEEISYLDGKKIHTKTYHGYIDENGASFCDYKYGNEIILDNVVYHNYKLSKYKYELKENLTIEDLLEMIDIDDDIDDIKEPYLRKIKNGYYISFSKEDISKVLGENIDDDIEILSKLEGKLIFKNNKLNEVELNLKIKNKYGDEENKITALMKFIDEKPTINVYTSDYPWLVEENSSVDGILRKIFYDKKIQNVNSRDSYILSNYNIYNYDDNLWAFGKYNNYELVEYDGTTFTRLRILDLKDYNFTGEYYFKDNFLIVNTNLSVYRINLETLEIELLFKRTKNLSLHSIYNDTMVYVVKGGNSSYSYGITLVDLKNFEIIKLNMYDNSLNKYFIQNEFICYESSSNAYYMYNLETSEIKYKGMIEKVLDFKYIDKNGNLYYTCYNESNILRCTNSHIAFKVGNRFEEKDGKLYIYDGSLVHIYEGNTYLGAERYTSKSDSNILNNKNFLSLDDNGNVYIKGENGAYNINSNTRTYYKDIYIENKLIYNLYILHATSDYVLLYSRDYYFIYNTSNFEIPILAAKSYNYSSLLNYSSNLFKLRNLGSKTIVIFEDKGYLIAS